jgi:hypothetical protein
MEHGPVFIAGIERSGTSLIYALLASHPNIAMTRRTNLWAFFYKRFGDLSQPENLERCLDAMKHYKRLLVLNPDYDRLRQEFQQGEPTYPRLFELMEQHHTERLGKSRWGDKSLNTERYVDDIFAAYPNAKMIHMIRDPRDRYASALTRWKNMKGKVGAGTAMWLSSMSMANHNHQRYPDRYKILRYETLASQPEETLRMLCTFIGEEYTPAMLSMKGAENFNESGNSSYGQFEPGRISTKSIGRFRKVLSKHEVAFIQTYTRRDMLPNDYELEPLNFSLRDNLSFYCAAWPANLARMIGWWTREEIENRKGRSVPAHTIIDDADGL